MSLWEIVKEEIPDPLDDLPNTTVPVSEAAGDFIFTYEGVDINFPYKAYTSQQEMMQKIIEGVNRSEHCLLESPTGTGKTAALLCALLAWQKFDVERQSTYISPKKFKLNLQDTPNNGNRNFDDNEEDGETSKYFRPQLQCCSEGDNDGHNFGDNDEDGETSKYFRPQPQPHHSLLDQPTQIISNAHILTQKCAAGNNRTVQETRSRMVRRKLCLDPANKTVDNLDNTDTVNTSNLSSSLNSSKSSESDSGIRKPEKGVTIYYASRTHSQIKNVVNQLKQTKYSNTPMLILASRTQTCINDVALAHENGVDEMCEKLRNPPSRKSKRGESPQSPAPTCGYFGTREKFVGFPSSRNYTPWDIEDIQEYGRGCGSCPYYGIKALQEKARIVFCHYNHLLHGNIRRASKITIDSNSILVFDEAHNIEELCMNIASKNITLEAIDLVRLEFDEAMKGSGGSYGDIPGWKRPALQHLTAALKRLSNWLARQSGTDDGFRQEYDPRGKVTKSTKDLTSKVIETFSKVGFGPDDLSGLWRAYFVMENKSQKGDANAGAFRIKAKHMRKLNSLLYVMNFLFKRHRKPNSEDPNAEEYEYVRLEDFKVFLVKLNNSNLELHLRCLNPAVAFEEMKPARTVIVTSGTLSPIASFSSELHMDFKHVLSASHVLGPDRIFSAIITKREDASNKELDFSYGSLNRKPLPNYEHHQLELGNIILEVSKNVQYGLLVFGSSKSFMAKLKESWRRNGILKKLKKIKDVYFEHETGTGPQFNEMHALYKESTRKPKGAILFGFLRGRASEGVDFKDNEARVVLTIGIPFLPFKEETIVAKRAYNDKKFREEKSPMKTRISGREWYNGAAFRTLNQAFGRCVRHSADWGIILILDSRVSSPSYRKYLSAWVKESMNVIGRTSVGSLQTVIPQVNQFLQHLADSSGSGSCYSSETLTVDP